MEPINWIRVFFHLLWIIGASLILTFLGYIWYARSRKKREPIFTRGYHLTLSMGFLLIFAGLGFLVRSWWLAGVFWLGTGLILAHVLRIAGGRQKKSNEKK
ncbi:MAG: hypothetical protein JXB26_18830 [Candidatus Aminicenantes bacterium]|nr:hypothetical protein [Candidatus Aminicenantes bacterium]